jgi:DNA polymerase-1
VWLVKNQTEILYKTTAEHCNICDGKGKIRKIKKDGQDFNRDTTCKNCSGRGFTLLALKEIAGLRCVPTGVQDVAIGGFSTDKETLQLLAATATGDRKSFLTKILEVNKIEVYLSTFIDGIRRGLRGKDNILHTSFMQCVTATGRLSSRQPNMQNQPRGGTFPVRASFVSRFEDGVMTEADAKQLEFRSVGELSGNKQIFEDIINNIDVHSVTAKFIGCSRQDGKSFTFAPLYGAMPEGKALKIAEYYRHFIKKYSLEEWHGKVATDIINNGGLQRLPSGREFYFKDTKRYPSGGFSNATQIKNYMVQGWATGDIIPIFCVEVWKLLKQVGIRSVLVLTVHDSVCVDTAPEDKKIIIDILNKAWYNTIKIEPIKRWNYEIKIPLEIEIKQGKDLLHLNAI